VIEKDQLSKISHVSAKKKDHNKMGLQMEMEQPKDKSQLNQNEYSD